MFQRAMVVVILLLLFRLNTCVGFSIKKSTYNRHTNRQGLIVPSASGQRGTNETVMRSGLKERGAVTLLAIYRNNGRR